MKYVEDPQYIKETDRGEETQTSIDERHVQWKSLTIEPGTAIDGLKQLDGLKEMTFYRVRWEDDDKFKFEYEKDTVPKDKRKERDIIPRTRGKEHSKLNFHHF